MQVPPASSPAQKDFWGLIPRRSRFVFFGAVFFTFAPVGLMFVSSFAERRPPGPVLLYAALSGAVAVSWAGTFMLSRWFVAPLVVIYLLMAALAGPFADSPLGLREARPSLAGFAVVAAIAVGYVLFLVFINGQGRETMRLVTEMTLARRMHGALVAPIDYRDERIEAVGTSVTSSEMGGDLLDLVERDGTVDLFVADVSGHGVGAGLVMGMLKSGIHTALLDAGPLEDLARKLNEVLERSTNDEVFATLAALRVHPDGTATCVLAGHHPIVHWRAATAEVRRIESPSLPLGMLPGRRYVTRPIEAAPGDLLAVYTDGLNETFDPSGQELGHDELERTIVEHAQRPLNEVQRAIFDVAERHGPQIDDRTLLLVRFAGRPG